MLDSKFFFTLVGLIVAVFAICNINMTSDVSEGFGGLSTSNLIHSAGNQCCSSPNNCHTAHQNYHQSAEQNQNSCSANIKYDDTSCCKQAKPHDPLNYANMVSREYDENCDSSSCCSKQECNSYSQHDNNDEECVSSTYPDADDMSYVEDMTTVTQPDKSLDNFVNYERNIVSNLKSYTQGFGCSIRGDVPIHPDCHGVKEAWFKPSVTPHTDLKVGAMSILGGSDNCTAKQTANLVRQSALEKMKC